ncbi:hypothetical protein FQZ97_618060 [compost metagenome]
MPTPSPNANWCTRCVEMPDSRAAMGSWAVARTAMPHQVFFSTHHKTRPATDATAKASR